jgi:ribosomal protein S12 methylthiotransferase accessory factor
MVRTDSLDRVETLVSPYGVVSHVGHRRPARGLDWFSPWRAHLGSGLPERTRSACQPRDRDRVGAGFDQGDPDGGRLIAIAEAAERYAAGDFLGETIRWARAAELDGAVVDLTSVPRCSARELAVDGCPLAPIDPDATIRWVRGTDLATGQPTWIPAVMACYRLRNPRPGERFWYRISTGYAVHTDPVEALVGGICEVIERDAVAVTWLQRLALPLVPVQRLSEFAAELLDWCERHFVETYLFDATSDMAVPTVYCLQIAEFDTVMRQAVSCGTGRTITAAVDKALLEIMRYRLPASDSHQAPAEFRDFSDIADGAVFMGRPEMAPAFDFLIAGAQLRATPQRSPLPEAPVEALAAITRTLADRGMRAVAVDRTSAELAEAGLTAVCVVIPELQPMSLLPLAQYRAHPRLYEAPLLMGYPSAAEEELNPWPQPFA